MAENKTKPTNASVEDYIASGANAQQCTDSRELEVYLSCEGEELRRRYGQDDGA